MDPAAQTARNELFQKVSATEALTKAQTNVQQLKPRCVELSQLALQYDGQPTKLRALETSTSRLLDTLQTHCRSSSFDEKLADYVFFPISTVFRSKQKHSDRLVELALQCLHLLLITAWSRAIAVDLAKQLLILLTFVAGGTPGEQATASEEVKTAAYKALAALFKAFAYTPMGVAALTDQTSVPALGHCVSVLLEGVTDGPSTEAQIHALAALHAVWSCVKDLEALASFFPGTVSGLTKCLMPTTASRRSKAVLVQALQLLEKVLTAVIGDLRTRNIERAGPDAKLNKSWLKASAAQIKLALGNVVRLRKSADVEVQSALKKLCITLLDECHTSLADCSSMLVETWLSLANEDDTNSVSRQTTLGDLALIYPEIGDLMKTTLYNWVTSLPRVMQSNDESAKTSILSQISQTYGLLSTLDIESGILDDTLADSLRNSVSAMITPTKSSPITEDTGALAITSNISRDFTPLLMPHGSQKRTRDDFSMLISKLGSTESQVAMAGTMLEYMRNSTPQGLLPAFWLSFNLIKASTSRSADLEDFLTDVALSSDESEAVMDELYSYSISVLSDDEQPDWRVQALAMEVVAYSAERAKMDFRPELVDALYPVVQLLGSPVPQLREHAMISLNMISSACGYNQTSDLILENVDYMVNAVSLKLNTFDISPQAPQVLTMMIKLSGSSILPYLDDVVDSIFAALDNFHGYPRLVDALFGVLGEVVEEGSKSDQLRLTSGKEISHRKTAPEAPSISSIVEILKKRQKTSANTSIEHEDFPQEPWKSAQTLLDEKAAQNEDSETPEENPAPSDEVAKIRPTKTYSLLQSITRLSQHYLTSSSPYLRRRLLVLISTSSTALHNNEDEFLPLINDIWPVVMQRLYDEEPFVVIAAAQTLSSLCESAGDFLTSRIKNEWVPIIKLFKSMQSKVAAERKGRAGRGLFSQNQQVWEALVAFLVVLLRCVAIDDDMFDEILDVAGDLLLRHDVREALEVINKDAVWLALYMRKEVPLRETPVMDGYEFAPMMLA